MKAPARLIASLSLFLTLALAPFAGKAQTPASSPLPQVPTTRILAIGKLNASPTPEQLKLLASREVPDTLRLYLAGRIDQWYSITNGNGVVFLLNASSVEEAQAVLDKLPLGQAKLMTFQLIPMGPLSPLALLLPKPETAP